jgi:AHBA synthesis associated protein
MPLWVCDVNGVLVDSSRVTRAAFAATAERYRLAFTEALFRGVKGLDLFEAYRRLDPGNEPSSRRDYHLRFVHERIEEVTACPYEYERLMLARSVGIGIGAVTSYGETAEAYLVHTGLYPLIHHLVTADELHRPKPHPDVILMVIRLFDIECCRHEDGHVMYVGDTAVDIHAGRAAGVTTIGASYGLSDLREIQAAEPDHIIHSFDEMRRFMAPAAVGLSRETAASR